MAEVWVEVFAEDRVADADRILYTIIHRGPDGDRRGGTETNLRPWRPA